MKRRAKGVGCRHPGRKACRRNAVTSVNDVRLCAVHAADQLFGRHVRQRGVCANCHTDADLQWCHVHSRRYKAIRWTDANSVCLCASCHLVFTLSPAEWEQWCRDHGIDWDGLRISALTLPPQDPMEIVEEFGEAA